MSETHTEAAPAPETPAVTTAEPAVETPVAAPEAAPQPTERGPAAEGTAAAPAEPVAPEPTSLLGAEQPQEAAVEAEPAAEAPVTYEPFTLPEGIEADQERMTAFSALAAEYKLPQEAAQKLVDLYSADRRQLQESVERHQHDTFTEMNQNAVREFENDPQIGRNRRDTTLNNARSAIRMAFTDRDGNVNEQHLKEFWNVLAFSGAGNYLPVIRAFNNLHRMLSERAAPPMPAGAPAPRQNGHDAADRRYPNMPARTP